MKKFYVVLKSAVAGAIAITYSATAAPTEASLPENEQLIGANFELGVAQDSRGRQYMLEFSDPQFLSHTSKLRKVWGRAKVLDGETLVIAGEKIRLAGIRAPDISETCKEKVLNIQFDAGAYSLQRLKTWALNEKAVVCYVDGGEPSAGTCFIWGIPGPMNLARMLVREGAAWASPLGLSPYTRDEGWAEGLAAGDRNAVRKNIWHAECKRPSQ